jgi:nucleoside-diphosphate-sugar epimerase
MDVSALDGALVLVTGGAGFIGSHLISALLERGAEVRVVDNFATGHRRNIQHCLEAIDLIEGDIRDPEVCRRACRGARYLLHQAALGSVPRSMSEPDSSFAVNVSGTANLLADVTRAAELLGFRARTTLEEGLRLTRGRLYSRAA